VAKETSLTADRSGIRTLVVDIGASAIKALVLDRTGQPINRRARIETPSPRTPAAVMEAIRRLAKRQDKFDRVAVGFPGIVRSGIIETAVNLHKKWRGFDLARKLQSQLKRSVRVVNDADLQGLGAVSGRGVELVITLGAGFGSALFVDGKLVPNLEVALYPFRQKTYEKALGNAARKKVGNKKWNKRLCDAITALNDLFHYDRLYIGGGNSKKIRLKLPRHVRVVSNNVALRGGIALWKE
jgi:polyphosphate glucokinase